MVRFESLGLENGTVAGRPPASRSRRYNFVAAMSVNASTEQAQEALRREHGVRVVSPAEEGSAAGALPAGVYGFTGSPALASPLFATPRYRNFEVHRLSTGVALIGFTTPADAARLTGSSSGLVTVKVYPTAEGDATALVSIPYDRIVQHRQYSVRNTAAVTLQVLSARALTV